MSKKTLASLAACFVLAVGVMRLLPAAQANQLVTGLALPFYVYHGPHAPDNHFAPSGWMGDYRDLKFDDHFQSPQDDHSYIKIHYTARSPEAAGWAGIYWQHPANNWGNREGGYNLNGAHQLVFKARGEKGEETISEFKVGGIEGTYRDSGAAEIGPLTLSTKWQQYTIPLDGQELSSIAGGFCLTLSRQDNPDGAVVYLDDIRFE